jgi:hypothetical protein
VSRPFRVRFKLFNKDLDSHEHFECKRDAIRFKEQSESEGYTCQLQSWQNYNWIDIV